MRNLFISVFAACAVLLAGCQEIGPVLDGGNVTFALQTPEQVATKAIGDGGNVNIVHYEIYLDKEGHKNDYRNGTPLIKTTVPMKDKTATVSLNLLEDQKYVALFWAQVDGYSYYNLDDLREVKTSYQDEDGNAASANDEARAAFCQVYRFDTDDYVSATVELKRPFAQLNLGTDKAMLNKDYVITLEESKVVVKGVGTAFSVAKMAAWADNADVVFDFAKVPDQDLAVNGQAYAYAGMNYFFVPNDATNVDVEYYIKTDVGMVDRAVLQVPVKTNYRTNIIGDLLTKETVIEVVVDERFNEDLPDTPYDPSRNVFIAIKEGGVVTLGEDLVLTRDNPMIVTAGEDRPVTIDLNGYDIVSNEELYVQGKVSALISVQNGSVVTIKDSKPEAEWGTVESLNKVDYAVEVRGGTLNIEGGNFAGAYTAAYALDGVINISGGRYSDVLGDNTYVLNLYGDAQNAEINVTGGTFVGFDPSYNKAENPAVDFVEEGYRSFDNGDGTYTVRQHVDYVLNGNTYEVYTADGLAKWAYMANNVDNTVGLKLMDDVVLPAYEIEADDVRQTYKFTDKAITVEDGVPSGSNWVPVGHYLDDETKFRGCVDGNGKVITGLLINNGQNSMTGFIGCADTGDTQETSKPEDVFIENLTINNAVVYSKGLYVGAIAGYVRNIKGISNCHVTSSSITGEKYTGGLVGYLYTRRSDNKVVMSDCSNDAATYVSGDDRVGGLVGQNYGSVVLNGSNSADVSGVNEVGGIVGFQWSYQSNRSAYIIACVNSGSVSASEYRAGGIIGYNLWDKNHIGAEAGVIACSSTASVIKAKGTRGLIVGYPYANDGDYEDGITKNKTHIGSWAIKTSSVSQVMGDSVQGDFTACYAYGSAAEIKQADVDAMNAAIANYNVGRSADDKSYCPYKWSWTEGSLPVLVK